MRAVHLLDAPENPKLVIQCWIPKDLTVLYLLPVWIRLCRCFGFKWKWSVRLIIWRSCFGIIF